MRFANRFCFLASIRRQSELALPSQLRSEAVNECYRLNSHTSRRLETLAKGLKLLFQPLQIGV